MYNYIIIVNSDYLIIHTVFLIHPLTILTYHNFLLLIEYYFIPYLKLFHFLTFVLLIVYFLILFLLSINPFLINLIKAFLSVIVNLEVINHFIMFIYWIIKHLFIYHFINKFNHLFLREMMNF